MNILIYTADSIYKDWLVDAFSNIANKSDVIFDIANLVDKDMFSIQKKKANYNLIIFDEDSIDFDFFLKILINCKDSDRNIIYLRTVKYYKQMSNHTRDKILGVMRALYSESIQVLQDLVELCNIINKLGNYKSQTIIKQNSDTLVDIENALEFKTFLEDNFKEHYVEGICLIQQSQYIISILNEK